MPTYDYECQKCGHTFEHFQSFSEPDLKKCPQCDGRLKRLIGMGAGIIFKGSGFHETDYRKSEYKKQAEKEAAAARADASENKSDNKACKAGDCSLSKDGKKCCGE